MYYISNLETGKTEIYFSKEQYKALPAGQRSIIKSYCNFSGDKEAWITKGKTENAVYILSKLKDWNFDYRGKEGQPLSFAEQVEQKQERAEYRAERMEGRIEKWKETSDRHRNVARHIAHITQGEPIKLGHHSEDRHRKALEKMDNNMRKSCEATDKAKYYAERLAAALRTASGKQYQDTAYLGNRIRECKSSLATYELRLQGKVYAHSTPEPISISVAKHWKTKENQELEKLDYYEYCLQQCIENGAKVFNKETLKDKTKVLVDGDWIKIVKLNKTTVSVLNTTYSDPEYQVKDALKYPYHRIKGAA